MAIREIEKGTIKAELETLRGYSCIMDAKFVEQDPEAQYTLISKKPGYPDVNLHERIQLVDERTPVAGEHD